MASFDLTGKAALVTGSTRGIGRAIAEALMAQGARVVISSEDAADTARVGAAQYPRKRDFARFHRH